MHFIHIPKTTGKRIENYFFQTLGLKFYEGEFKNVV